MLEILKKIFTPLSICFVVLSVLGGACEYDFIDMDLPDPDRPVTFSGDILPIFSSGDNCTSCHHAGFMSPDLTTTSAYQSIVPRLLNVSEPEKSKIYIFPHPTSATHQFKKYTPYEAGLVLAWIKQGANNN